MNELGQNAGRIGNLTITSEMLAALLDGRPRRRRDSRAEVNGRWPRYDKLVVVTRKTALEELVERFNTRDQARFYIEHMGRDFAEYQAAHDAYHAAPRGAGAGHAPGRAAPSGSSGRSCRRSRSATRDVVVTWARTAWSSTRPSISKASRSVAFNPDPARIDGVLLPFDVADAGRPSLRPRMARATS